MLRRFLPLAVAIPLAGCALPPALVIASYAADGVLLVSTGKTSTDHLLSMAEKRDCAVWRVVKNESICQEFAGGKDPYEDWRDPGEVQVAVDSDDAGFPVDLAQDMRRRDQAIREAQIARQDKAERILLAQAGAGQPVTSARDVVGPANRPTGSTVSSAPLPPIAGASSPTVESMPATASVPPAPDQASPVTAMRPDQPMTAAFPAAPAVRPAKLAATPKARAGSGGTYVVLGSYKFEENATRVARQHQALNPSMRTVTVRGERYTRVVAGPYSSAEAAAIKRQLKSKDGIDAFIAQSCSGKGHGACIVGNDG